MALKSKHNLVKVRIIIKKRAQSKIYGQKHWSFGPKANPGFIEQSNYRSILPIFMGVDCFMSPNKIKERQFINTDYISHQWKING